MLHKLLRPFLPQPWTADSDLSTQERLKEIEAGVMTILAEVEKSYDFTTFTLDSFAQWVEAKRNRSLTFVPLRFPSTVSGGWLQWANKDWVFYEADALPLYQVHIQLHELSHMLCGHQTVNLDDVIELETVAQLMAYLKVLFENPAQYDDVIAQALLRSHRSAPEEIEAECLSALILERVSMRHFEKVLTQPVTFSRVAIDFYEAMGMA